MEVVPHAGTWIEIKLCNCCGSIKKSFPTRERGLKSLFAEYIDAIAVVVPHAGTWIEIMNEQRFDVDTPVVPHAGTWIEIIKDTHPRKEESSRSPRGNVD